MRFWRYLLGAYLAVIFVGCSTFNRDWKAAARKSDSGIQGRWVGRWQSQTNGHNDILRCLITKKNDNLYETRFDSRYKICSFFPVSFGYALDMNVTCDNICYQFKGQADLGKLAGGVYHYTGKGNNNALNFVYRAAKDHGTFKLQRPAEGE